jgi:hypothetical protein
LQLSITIHHTMHFSCMCTTALHDHRASCPTILSCRRTSATSVASS